MVLLYCSAFSHYWGISEIAQRSKGFYPVSPMMKIIVSREKYLQVNCDTEKSRLPAGLQACDTIIDFFFPSKNILSLMSPVFYLANEIGF